MTSDARLDPLKQSYRATLDAHGTDAAGVKMSPGGQRDRFARLAAIGDLRGARVIDVGCGVGDLYAYLRDVVEDLDYLGVDLMPEMVERAAARFPSAEFAAVDVLAGGLPEPAEYVLLSAVFNDVMDDPTGYLRDVVQACWPAARRALGFNFISIHASRREPEALAYHDPAAVLDWCVRTLTPRVELHHFYARADVAVVLRRDG